MLKKLQATIVIALLTVGAVYAKSPTIDRATTMREVAATIMPVAPEDAKTDANATTTINHEAINAEGHNVFIAETIAASQEFNNSTIPYEKEFGKFDGIATWADAQQLKAAKKAVRSATGTPNVKVGTLIAVETAATTGNTKSAALKLAKVDGSDTEYTLSNLANVGVSVNLTIDSSTGAVSIPKQVVDTLDTYGELTFCGLVKYDGKWYLSQNPVTGTVDSNGVVSVGAWCLVITQVDADGTAGKYYGALYASFLSSDWKPANATAKALNLSTGEEITYQYLIEQNGENDVVTYCLHPSIGCVLSGRLTANRTLVIPPQLMYTNALYGPFYNYPVNITYNESTSKYSYSVKSSESMTFVADKDNTMTLGGWAVSARMAPTQYVGYMYQDVTTTTTLDIAWPEVSKLSFDGAGTQQSPYLIKDAADMCSLAKLTYDGNSLDGLYFALTNDIDMSSISTKGYLSIGSDAATFNGYFDGKGYTIKNFKVDGSGFNYTGVFGYIGQTGKVENLNVEKMVGVTVGQYLGGIAAYSDGTVANCNVTSSTLDSDGNIVGGIVGLNTGSIKNCTFSGALYTYGSAGGICGQSSGEILDSHAQVTITIEGYYSELCKDGAGITGVAQYATVKNCWASGVITDSKGYSHTAGIAARCLYSTVENCFSTVSISAKRTYIGTNGEGDTYTGGVVGYASEAVINNCYNAGTITKTDQSYCVGGIVGYLGVGYVWSSTTSTNTMSRTSTITNCYNSGQIISYDSNAKKGVYGSTFTISSWTGAAPEDVCISNCYYDSQVNTFSEEKYGRNTAFFTNGLPEGFDSSVWTATTGFYPTLKYADGVQNQNLASAPLVLKTNDTASKVKVSFNVTSSSNVVWKIMSGSEFVDEDSVLTIKDNVVTVKDKYATSLIVAYTADGWGVKYYRLAIVPKVFEGEGTETDPYQIANVADFKKLHNAVANYAQAHTGDYFAMTADIDCTDSDFHGVGYGTSYAFGGSFDGRNHTVSGLTINGVGTDDTGKITAAKSLAYCGLFGITKTTATIKNVNIAADCSFNFYQASAPVVGYNQGLIENCRNYAPITAIVTYVSGITGYNLGTVSKCYNAGHLKIGSSYGGGIAGANVAPGVISLCQNDGFIEGCITNPSSTTLTQNQLGGITGANTGDIEYCVNNAIVEGAYSVGGITGYNSTTNDAGNIKGSLNNAFVYARQQNNQRGAVIGSLGSNGTLANNYYDASINVNGGCYNNDVTGITGLSTAELVAGVCPSELKAIGADEIFDFTANAYPSLKLFADEPATKVLRTMYAAFGKGQVRSNLQANVALSTTSGTEWALTAKKNFALNNNTLEVTVPSDNTVASDTLTAKNGNYTKTYFLGSVPVIFKGNGSASDPYLIETPSDWNKLADFVEESKWEYPGEYFRVANDIDFAGDSIRVIAHDGVTFQGIFDGAGHTVKGYIYVNSNATAAKSVGTINPYIGKFIGLFGTLGSTGVIKNLTIDGSFTGYQSVAALCGYVYGNIENVTHKGTISNSTGSICSGMVFRLYTGSSLKNCVNEGTVTAKTTYATGFAYDVQKGATIENCYNRGTVKATTTGAYGIAYTVAGGLIDCGNEGKLEGTGTMAGIASTLDSTAYAVRCYNKSDITATSGSYAIGLFNSTKVRYLSTKATQVPDNGYIRDCYNTGNLTGKSYVFGIVNALQSGWTMEGCYNTGNCTATNGNACGLTGAVTGATADWNTKIDNCYNTGNVSGTSGKCGGLFLSVAKFTTVTNCHNLGNVSNTANTICAAAGIASTFNGTMENCFNAGDITSAGYAIGGLAGYISNGDATQMAVARNCFNIGNVSTTYSGALTNGNAGGLFGYVATSSSVNYVTVENCFNTGNVTAPRRVAGLIAGMFSASTRVTNCYNAGQVNCTDTDDITSGDTTTARYLQSGTIYTNNYTTVLDNDTVLMLKNCNNCYYDKNLFSGVEFRSVAGSPKTTSELCALNISDAYEASTCGGYPVLKVHADKTASAAASIAILMSNQSTENETEVSGTIRLVAPEGTTWAAYDYDTNTSSTNLTINGNEATPTGKGKVILIATTTAGFSRVFELNVSGTGTGIDSTLAGKEVISSTLYDLQGRVVAEPTPGNVYIERTVYTDGTSRSSKVFAR